jgi:hypothetical protein
VLGGIILPIGLGLLTRALHRNVLAEIYGFLSLTGAGLGMTMSAITIQVRFSQPPDKIAAVVSLSTFVSIVSYSTMRNYLSAVFISSSSSIFLVGPLVYPNLLRCLIAKFGHILNPKFVMDHSANRMLLWSAEAYSLTSLQYQLLRILTLNYFESSLQHTRKA